MRIRTFCALLALLLLALSGLTALAEVERGDLEERFRGETTLEYQGTQYQVRKRLTPFLFWALAPNEDGEKHAGLLMVVVVDDAQKTTAILFVDARLAMRTEAGELPLWQAYDLLADDEARCPELLAWVNALLPEPLLESYFELDIDGLELLDGEHFALEEGETFFKGIKRRLKGFAAGAEDATSDELMGMFDELGEYLETNIKSGLLMKIADKADRYERLTSEYVPGECIADADGVERFYVDPEALMPILLNMFYEENTY